MYMFTLIVILAIGSTIANEKKLVHLTAEKLYQILPHIMKCADETSVNFEELKYLGSEKGDRGDKNVGSFISCSFKRTGYSDDRGNVDINKFLQLFPMESQDAVKQVAADCDALKTKNVSEKLHKFVVCFIKTSPVLLML